MKWTSFSLIAGFLFATNVLVNTSVDAQSSQFTDLPPAASEALNGINPQAFSRLPGSAQQEATRRLNAALAEARATAYNQNPVSNGTIPTGNISSVPNQNSRSQSLTPSSTTATTPSPQQGTIDPLGSSLSFISTDGEQSALADYTTLRLANQKELQLWKQYNDEMYDQIKLLDRSYLQLKITLDVFKSRLKEAMLDKLPATIPNCVKPS